MFYNCNDLKQEIRNESFDFVLIVFLFWRIVQSIRSNLLFGRNTTNRKFGNLHGELKGTEPEFHMAVETKWDTWRKLYPASQVVTYNTGFNRNYGNYPYGDYKRSETLIFPVRSWMKGYMQKNGFMQSLLRVKRVCTDLAVFRNRIS